MKELPVKRVALALILAAVAVTPAQAGELFGGVYVHDIDSPFTLSGVEKGFDVQLGYRGGRIGRTPLQPYAFAAVNTAGKTSYAAAGLSTKFGDRLFIRPGLGIAVHTGSAANFDDPTSNKVEFGSRVLFEPELGVGARLNSRTTVEASLVHLSHAQIFGKENPGIDNLGVRLSVALP
jgi:lipid A 3-O-deacylase